MKLIYIQVYCELLALFKHELTLIYIKVICPDAGTKTEQLAILCESILLLYVTPRWGFPHSRIS